MKITEKFLFWVILFVAFIFAGCSQPLVGDQSILVISIANFRGDDLGCGSFRDSVTPQLDIICSESIRFTHAYTPSVLVNPALASILTGLYPVENGVHRNDAGRYDGSVKPLSVYAHELGLETILVSGGVPVLRKTPLSKGFDEFDDSIRINGSFYRPADAVVQRFLNQAESRTLGSPFFAVLHFADLEFPEIISLGPSQSDRREGNEIGKLQEIDEAIGSLRTKFQSLKIWDRLTVVIVGLQGTERLEHNGLSKGLNLYDEIVRVPLLIKPSRKPTDHAPSWKVDNAISLVDVGVMLFRVLKSEDLPKGILPHHEILDALQAREIESSEIPIFTESDLPAWRNWGPRLLSMRLGEWNYIPFPDQKLFNTYTDRLETHNLFPNETTVYRQMRSEWQKYRTLIQPPNVGNKYFVPFSISEKLRVAKLNFSKATPPQEKLRELSLLEFRRSDDWQVLQWNVQFLYDLQNWGALKRLLKDKRGLTSEQKQELENWRTFITLKSRNGHLDEPNSVPLDCLYLAIALKRFNLSELEQIQGRNKCSDGEIQLWLQAFIEFKRKRIREAVGLSDAARNMTEKRQEQTEFAKQFWIAGATWDYREELPAGPSNFDLFLSLVSNQEFLSFVRRK